jgi:hypothetical protein
MLIKYIIPEDGDEELHPNVFNISNTDKPSVGEIVKVGEINLIMTTFSCDYTKLLTCLISNFPFLENTISGS